ncbi:MAG: serine hydrolase domain-containing protein [Ardenticatenaceae bacterium]|nr:serine hydrolase domain-containing protein [Ardenticatenaceae bacterium]
MTDKSAPKSWTPHQIGAVITLSGLLLWSGTALWIHSVAPAGADLFEMTYLSTISLLLLLLLPLYWRRIRWAYIGGIFIVAALLIGLIKAAADQTLVLSWSAYNLTTVLMYAIALGYGYSSIQAYRELPPSGAKRSAAGLGVLFITGAIFATLFWTNWGLVHDTMWQWTLNRIENRLENAPSLDEQIQILVDEGDLDSAAAGIVVNNELVWAKAYGGADLDTVYDIASITKPFVATAVLQLYERGEIDLDDDVNTYLPFKLRHPDYPEIPITIRMLLTHQAGLSHFTTQFRTYHMGPETVAWMAENTNIALQDFESLPSQQEFLAGYVTPTGEFYTPDVWLEVQPGADYSYSTPGYDLLAQIVESVTGQPFPAYARENIFTPLGMNSSGFSVTEFPERVAIPHERLYGVLSKSNVELPLSDQRTIGGGGMISTVPDMAQFVVAHLNQGEVDGFQLLEPPSIALMQEKVVTFPLGQGDLNQDAAGIGLGHVRNQPWNAWGHLYDMHGATGHGGSWWGYQSQMWFVNEEDGGYGMILLINTEGDLKGDTRSLWLFSSPLQIQTLLMEEARLRYQESMEN